MEDPEAESRTLQKRWLWGTLRRPCREKFKTSHLHSDEFKPIDSGFYVREAETDKAEWLHHPHLGS